MPFFDRQLFTEAEATTGNLTDPAYLAARTAATTMSRGDLDAALGGQQLDAIVAPTNGPAWTTDLVNGDHFWVSTSGPAAVAGYPITVPSTLVPSGTGSMLPLGVSLIGPRRADARTLVLAAGVEDTLHARQRPPTPPAVLAPR